MDAALKDEKRFAALDLEFHVTLAEASENFLIVDLVAMIRGQLEKALSRVLLLPNARPLSLKEHVSVVNAIKRRDPEAGAGGNAKATSTPLSGVIITRRKRTRRRHRNQAS